MRLINKIVHSIYFPFIIFFGVYLGIHCFCTVNFNDDLMFSKIPQNEIIDRLKWNYNNWSTRLIIEYIYYNIYHFPLIIWKVLDSFMMTLIAYSLMRLLAIQPTREMAELSCILVLFYPFLQMASAGWISTTANYTWPIAVGLYALTYLRNISDGKKSKAWQHALYMLALLYGGNAEQIVCLLLGFYFIFICYFIYVKKFEKTLVMHIFFLMGLFGFKITGPGNNIVVTAVANTWYHEYFSLNKFKCIVNTFVATMSYFIKYFNPTFLILIALLALLVWKRHNDYLYRGIAGINLLICYGIALFSSTSNSFFYGFSLFENGDITADNFNHLAEYIPIATYVFIIGSIAISFYLIWGFTEKMILAQLIFGGGLATRMILSFSSSIYASGMRTYAAMYFCLIACVYMLVQEYIYGENLKGINMNQKKLKFVLFAVAILSVYSTLIAL